VAADLERPAAGARGSRAPERSSGRLESIRGIFRGRGRLAPALSALRDGLLWLPFLSLLVTVLWWFLHVRPVRTLGNGRKLAYLAATLVVQLAICAASALASFWIAPRSSLFDRHQVLASEAPPDGMKVAYLGLDCFLTCIIEVHVRKAYSPDLHRVQTVGGYIGDAKRLRLSWSKDSRTVEASGFSPSELVHGD